MAEKKGTGGEPQTYDERTGRYGVGGRLAKKDEQKLAQLKRIYDTVDTSDESIPRSLSAKANNYEITLPNGKKTQFTEGTHITNKQVFAGAGTKTPIRDIDRIVKCYHGDPRKWTKVKAFGFVNYKGKSENAEVHWYEEPTVGKVEFKIKVQPNGSWWL